jgi:hypothetical protein
MNSKEPVKVLPMAKLLRLAKEKEQREREASASESFTAATSAPETSIPQPGIPFQLIPQEKIPDQAIPEEGIPAQTIRKVQRYSELKQERRSRIASEQSADRGYYPTFNDLDDNIIPAYKLDTYEQSVLRRLYRLSRGFKSQECEAGLGALSKACNISRSQVQKTISSLMTRGLIHSLGHSQNGTRYRVLAQLPAVPHKGMPLSGIPHQEEGIPQESERGIPQDGNNKNNKDLINTHTNTSAVAGVRSRFSLEECRQYAEHLRASGQGINNPGGYATTIHRTGEADKLIERFISPTSDKSEANTSACPDCQGTGFYYPKGKEQGVAKCPHNRLTI